MQITRDTRVGRRRFVPHALPPLAIGLSVLCLSGCGLISLPMEALEDSLQRDDEVHARYGKELNLVSLGDGRATVLNAWGSPRRTLPAYPEFDLYFVVKSSDKSLRVLPGDYNDLSRTSLYVLRVSYSEGQVAEIRVFGSNNPGSRRDWCDENDECGEIFMRHFVSGEGIVNPLIIAAGRPGIDVESTPPVNACEVIVFPSDVDPYWLNALVYVGVRHNQVPLGVITADTYLRFSRTPGNANVNAGWESSGGGGALAGSGDSGLDFECHAASRTYLAVGPKKTGFWAINRGVQVTQSNTSDALDRLADLREIRLPSAELAAAASQ